MLFLVYGNCLQTSFLVFKLFLMLLLLGGSVYNVLILDCRCVFCYRILANMFTNYVLTQVIDLYLANIIGNGQIMFCEIVNGRLL